MFVFVFSYIFLVCLLDILEIKLTYIYVIYSKYIEIIMNI